MKSKCVSSNINRFNRFNACNDVTKVTKLFSTTSSIFTSNKINNACNWCDVKNRTYIAHETFHFLQRWKRFCFKAMRETMTMMIWVSSNCDDTINNKLFSLSINMTTISSSRLRAMTIKTLRWFKLRDFACDSNNCFNFCSMIDQCHNSRRTWNLNLMRERLSTKLTFIKSRLKNRLWLLANFESVDNCTMSRCHWKLTWRKIANKLSINSCRKSTSLS